MNTQQKFIQILRLLAATHRLEVIDDADYSNTGTLRVQRPGDFGDILTLRYDFQRGGSTINMAATVDGAPFRADVYCETPAQLADVIEQARAFIMEASK